MTNPLYPVCAPLVDQFSSIQEQLAYDIVDGWDLNDTVSYCIDAWVQSNQSMSLEDLVELYEDHYGHSIVNAITAWSIAPSQWDQFVQAKAIARTQAPDDGFISILLDSAAKEEQEFNVWSICLLDCEGTAVKVLEVANVEEADLIVNSINEHYF